MNPNPAMKKIGLSNHDRVLIIHADDIGMCQATLSAFEELHGFGLVTSGAVMPPCGWFRGAAAMWHNTQSMDLGVHITLTCEWDHYRWGPISTVDPATGLIDDEGYFFRGNGAVWDSCDPDAARQEMEAQIFRVKQAGIRATHIDTHMGTVLNPKILVNYVQLGVSHHLVPLAVRLDEEGWLAQGADLESAKMAAQFMGTLEEMGVPLHDGLFWVNLRETDQRYEKYVDVLKNLPCGISRIYAHPAQDTPELRAICPDWRCRVEDYHILMREDLKKLAKDLGITLVSYKTLQQIMP